jgi:hypothetical protein
MQDVYDEINRVDRRIREQEKANGHQRREFWGPNGQKFAIAFKQQTPEAEAWDRSAEADLLRLRMRQENERQRAKEMLTHTHRRVHEHRSNHPGYNPLNAPPGVVNAQASIGHHHVRAHLNTAG